MSAGFRLSTAAVDRAAGVLLGQAIGDAWRTVAEPGSPGVAADRAASGAGTSGRQPGEWSAALQAAVRIALMTATGADLTSTQALSRLGTGPGSGVVAPSRGEAEEPAHLARRAALGVAEPSDLRAQTRAQTLGAVAVVGLTALGDRDRTARSARAVAELTTADPLVGDACVLWSEAIRVAVREARFDLAGGNDLLPPTRRTRWRERIDTATGADPWAIRRAARAAGHDDVEAVGSTMLAAWALITSTPVPHLDAANGSFPCLHLPGALLTLDDLDHQAETNSDARSAAGADPGGSARAHWDSVAATAGGLLGARWGASAIPASWRRILHGPQDLRGRDLVRLAILTARGGRDDRDGWPSGERMPYRHASRPAVALPGVAGVWLGGIDASGHPGDAAVSLCRLGTTQPQVRGARAQDQVEVWLVDSEAPDDNPNLHFVIDDAARTVLAMRDEGRQVLLHCVAMNHRTPSVATRVATLAGVPYEEAVAAVRTVIPHARRTGALWDAVRDLANVTRTARP